MRQHITLASVVCYGLGGFLFIQAIPSRYFEFIASALFFIAGAMHRGPWLLSGSTVWAQTVNRDDVALNPEDKDLTPEESV